MDKLAVLFVKLSYNDVILLMQTNYRAGRMMTLQKLTITALLNVYHVSSKMCNAADVDLCNCLFSARLSIRAATAFFSVGYAIYNINTITTRDLDSAMIESGAHVQNLLFNTREGMYCWELLNYTYKHRYADFIMHMHQMYAADMMVHRSIEYMLYHYSPKKLGRAQRAEWVIYSYYCCLNKKRIRSVSKYVITLKFSRVRR